jgi:sugar lactone lactonase YvrE
MRRTPLIPVAFAAASLVATAFAAPAHAAEPVEVAGGLVSPLSVAVAPDGTVYASQNFVGKITKVAPGGEPATVHESPGFELGGLTVVGDTLTFTSTSLGRPVSAGVYTKVGDAEPTLLANTWAYEKANNPDGNRKYGIQGLKKSCIAKIPKKKRAGMVAYKGIKESHPYATAVAGDVTYVADAAANAIFAVGTDGVSTVAVLPAVKVKVTKQLRKGFKLPKCVQGKTFKGEPVPTDVEIGPDGNLYVTTLGGGLGEQMPLGAVHRVTTAGAVSEMAGGLMTPVGLAISPTGTSYVSLLFPGVVMQQPLGGEPSPLAEVPFAGDVEFSNGSVYVTETDLTNDGSAPPAGKVLKFDVAASN